MKMMMTSALTVLALVHTVHSTVQESIMSLVPVFPVILTHAEKDYILHLHNRVRVNVKVPPLKWDEQLRVVAELWAMKCQFDHQPNSDYNDNLAASGKPVITNNTKIIDIAMKGFLNEEQYYRKEGNWDCMVRDWLHQTCSHYTQIVWKDTTKIGCAIIHCTHTPGTANLIVCVYDPSGNYIGETPY